MGKNCRGINPRKSPQVQIAKEEYPYLGFILLPKMLTKEKKFDEKVFDVEHARFIVLKNYLKKGCLLRVISFLHF